MLYVLLAMVAIVFLLGTPAFWDWLIKIGKKEKGDRSDEKGNK